MCTDVYGICLKKKNMTYNDMLIYENDSTSTYQQK